MMTRRTKCAKGNTENRGNCEKSLGVEEFESRNTDMR